MHITHVVENLNRGGLERVVIELVRAQREAGHECRVVCLFEPGSLAPELQDSGVEVQACGKRTGPDVVALARMRRLLARGGRGVLHSHNAAAHYHAVPAAAGLGFQRIVNTRHSMAGPDRGCRRERLYRRAARFTDAVVAVCDAARAQLADHGVRPRRELLAIPNGVRVDRYAPRHDAARGRLLAALGLPAGNRLLGSVGRLHPAKDQATLLRAFHSVHQAMPATSLVLVGEGSERPALEALVGELGLRHAVRLLGDRGDVPQLLQALDLFLLSSVTEGYPVALLEACAASLPIVATRVGGNAEIVRDGTNGRLVPARDPSAMAEAASAMLYAPAQAAAMGRRGRDWAMAEASFRKMAQRYGQVYAG